MVQVKVTVTNDQTGLTRETRTGDAGNYAFPLLPVGSYSLTAEQPGFRLQKRSDIRLNVDQVEIFRQGSDIVLREIPVSATAVFDLLASLPSDFMSDGRDDTPPQEREAF